MEHDFHRYLRWHMCHAESLADELCRDDINEKTYRTLVTDLKSLEKNLEELVVKKFGGGEYECPVCGAKIPVYLPFGVNPRKNVQCPVCSSLERHRAIWLLFQKIKWSSSNMHILHFAPEKIFYDMFSSLKDAEYWSVDLNPEIYEGRVKKKVDITDIPFEDNSFDLIVCTHVLEHIPDDKKAMSELYRVLKPKSGVALLTVPVHNMPTTFENPEYNTPELRLKYFGQEDHVRKYGLDYPDKLRDAKFFVEEITMDKLYSKNDLKKYGLSPTERFHLCKKLIE